VQHVSHASDVRPEAGCRIAPARLGRVFVCLGLLWLPLILGSHLVPEAADLFDLAATGNPYVVPGHALLLYVGVPLVLTSAGVALMTPGLCLALGCRAASVEGWIAIGFALTLPVVSATAIVVQTLAGAPVVGGTFIAVLGVVSLLSAVWGGYRAATGRGSWPFQGAWRTTVVAALVMPTALAAVLAPKLLWESFNGDGAHAMASARMAVANAFPFWDRSAGLVANFPGMSTMLFAFPASWFVRLFGELEVAVRAPYLLVLVVTHAGLVLVAGTGRRPLSPAARPLLWLGLVVYTVMQAYSATYDPYSADLSMPGLPDTLQAATFLGFMHAFLTRRWGWTGWWLALTLASSPAGLMLVGFWLGACWWLLGRAERRQVLTGAAVLVAVVIGMGLVPRLLVWTGHAAPGGEHGLLGLLQRFAFLQFTDWHRIVWVVLPSGIAPFLAFAAWRRLDGTGRVVLAVAAAYFVTFFVQAFVMIHHYVPAMLLPLAAWWRLDDADATSGLVRWRPVTTAAAGALALWLSLPATTTIISAARDVGRTMADRAGGYDRLDPPAFHRLDLLTSVLPIDANRDVPYRRYGGSPLAWGYYADRFGGGPDAAYVLVGPGTPSPTGEPPVAENTSGGLYVQNDATVRQHAALRPPTPAGSPVYWNPRGMLFGYPPDDGGPWILDLPYRLRAAGIDVDGLVSRLRGER